jgi:hypothetical protein
VETKGDFIFFIRAGNDMDHIVPVIYKLGEVKPGARIFVYLADYLASYDNDFRMKFLASRGVVIRHVTDEFGWPPFVRNLYFRLVKSSFLPVFYAARESLRAYGSRRIETRWFADRFFERHPDLACILHDHNGDLYRAVTARAREKNIATVALPHAADNFDNYMINDRQIDPYKICVRSKEPYLVDLVIAASQNMRASLIEKNCSSAENTAVLGSPRFCDEWQQILRRIAPAKMKLPETPDFKIAFMLPKRDKNSFEAECIRTVEMLSRMKNVQVAVKPHTRNERFRRFRASNVKFYGSEVSSHALIDWADVTLFSATSVIVDNLKQDKPVLFLRRTIGNKIAFERYIQSWNIDCRDDLAETVLRMQAGGQTRTYTAEERDSAIAAMIEPKGKDVLKYYVDEILALASRRAQRLEMRSVA